MGIVVDDTNKVIYADVKNATKDEVKQIHVYREKGYEIKPEEALEKGQAEVPEYRSINIGQDMNTNVGILGR